MRRLTRWVLATAMGVATALAVAALSQVPYGMESRERALLRLSWRTVGERVEACRALTPEEEDRLPRHMRPPEICEGRIAPYALTVVVDGDTVARDTIHGAGAREDRPIYVFRELELAPGAQAVEVRFRSLAEASARPPLEFAGWFEVAPREVVLLTYNPAERRLVLRRTAGAGVLRTDTASPR